MEPKLTGTERQIKWATDIRAGVINGLREDVKLLADAYRETDYVEAVQKIHNAIISELIKGNTSAAWWINNRQTLQCDFGFDTIQEMFPDMCSRCIAANM